jgi:purine-nucleoside phosphorylase
VNEIPVAVMQGRVHTYEGCSAREVVYPMRVLRQMEIQAAILTNAAGAINLDFSQGALVVIRDHLNLTGVNPLLGPKSNYVKRI